MILPSSVERCPDTDCLGHLVLYKATMQLEQLTIVDVPVWVCDTCGKRILTEEVRHSIRQMLVDAQLTEQRIKKQMKKFITFLQQTRLS